MHNFTIGITKVFAGNFEELLDEEGLDYDKEVRGNNIYFSFEDPDWFASNHQFPSEVMTYLITVAGIDDYAFIRMGNDVVDTEIHGTMKNFGMGLTRVVEIK